MKKIRDLRYQNTCGKIGFKRNLMSQWFCHKIGLVYFVFFLGFCPYSQSSILIETLNSEQRELVEKISLMAIPDQIEALKKKVELKLIRSHSHPPDSIYKSIGVAEKSVDDIKDLEGLYGKVQCGEKLTLIIADDAPPSTLVHEFIHFLQIKNDATWCDLDGRILSKEEKRQRALIFHHCEYEAFKILWLLKGLEHFSFEDRMLAIEGLDRENKYLISLNEKTLDESQSLLLQRDLETLHFEITNLNWKNRSSSEAGAVLQKMEILALKSCVDNEKAPTLADQINNCAALRYRQAELEWQKITAKEIQKFKDDSISAIIYSWQKPNLVPLCSIQNYKQELVDLSQGPTPCWVKWYQRNEKTKNILAPFEFVVRPSPKIWGAPTLSIDKKITLIQSTGPRSHTNLVYCYAMFKGDKNIAQTPIEKFGITSTSVTLEKSQLTDYNAWLTEETQGRNCSKLVKVFTGQTPQDIRSFTSKKYLFVINPVAFVSMGPSTFKSNLLGELNYERLHLVYDNDILVRHRVQKEWGSLNDEIRERFKNDHGSFDFSKNSLALKEYFSITRQNNPRKLF